MAVNHIPADDSTEPQTEFDVAAAKAQDVLALEGVTGIDALSPHDELEEGTLEHSIAWVSSPYNPLLRTAFNQPDADDVDGAAPGDDAPRTATSYLFATREDDGDDEDDDVPAFRLTETFTNRWDDEKAVIDAPAPWDVENEDVTPPNEVVKALEWQDHHYELDKSRGVWELDVSGLEELRELAEDGGYVWADDRDEQDETEAGEPEEDALDRLTTFAEEGDHIAVRYEKKNGNGVGTKAGVVTAASDGSPDKLGSTTTQGLVFQREDGNYNRVRRDDDGTPAAFSNGYYPFMGEALSVEVVPGDD